MSPSACVLTLLSALAAPACAANAPTGRADTIMLTASAALRTRVLFFLIVSPSLSLLSGCLPRRHGTSSSLYPPPLLRCNSFGLFRPTKVFRRFSADLHKQKRAVPAWWAQLFLMHSKNQTASSVFSALPASSFCLKRPLALKPGMEVDSRRLETLVLGLV